MSYCPKCGAPTTDGNTTFCSQCGVALKSVSASQSGSPSPTPVSQTKKDEQYENQEKHEKNEHGFVGYLIAGLILIVMGIFAVLQISDTPIMGPNQSLALMLLMIGIIIIVGALYIVVIARKQILRPKPCQVVA